MGVRNPATIPNMTFTAIAFLLLLNQTFGAPSCPPGTILQDESCLDCPAGTYQSQPNSTSCIPCAAGTFSVSAGAQGEDLCRRCLSGTFSAAGASSCTQCPPGSVSEELSARCFRCGPGQELVFRRCQKCERGSYSTEKANLDCTFCPAGFTTNGKGAKSKNDCKPISPLPCVVNNEPKCGPCDRGFFYNADTRDCEFCPRGTFSDEEGLRTCKPCPTGTFASSTGAEKCRPCPAGTVSDKPGAFVCKVIGAPCPSNHFIDGNGQCATCEPGFRLNTAAKKCVQCPPNASSPGGAVTKCTRCGRGRLWEPSLKDCLCKPGLVPTLDGRCVKCPKGTVRGDLASGSVCERCFPGTFAAKKGSTECTECPSGTFQPKEGQSKCLLCPAGTIERAFGRIECVSPRTNCPLGFERVQRPSRPVACEQDVCPGGTFRDEGTNGERICRRCFPGQKFDPVAKDCMQCGYKEVSDGGTVQSCRTCPNGLYRYNPEGDTCRCVESGYGLQDGKCKKCPPGTVSLYYKMTCTKCPKGTFARREGTTISCTKCLRNTFADEEGSAECKACPEGTVSYGFGESSCVPVSM